MNRQSFDIMPILHRIVGFLSRKTQRIQSYLNRFSYSVDEFGDCAVDADVSIIVTSSNRNEWPAQFVECLEIPMGLNVEYIAAGKKIPSFLHDKLCRSGCHVKRIQFSRFLASSIIRNTAASYANGRWVLFVSADSLVHKISLISLVQKVEEFSAGALGLRGMYQGKQLTAVRLDYRQSGLGPLLPFDGPIQELSVRNDLIATIPGFIFCSRDLFIRANMFDERLSCGLEEIAFCWNLRRKFHKKLVLADYLDGAPVSREVEELFAGGNRELKKFYACYKSVLQRELLKQRLTDSTSRGSKEFSIGLVVTDDADDTMAGDVFTAQDMALFLRSELGWNTRFLPRLSKSTDWYDVSGLDCVLVLLDNYNIRKMRNARSGIIIVAWLRNWFDRWVDHPWFELYDLALCSSERAKNYVVAQTSVTTGVLRIASNSARFNPAVAAQEALQCDFCFTGSYWGSPREIEKFNPNEIGYTFAVYGSGWKEHKNFSDCWRGEIPYAQLPAAYASTKLLLDDANHVTKPWGSVNSRVFDALASGVLVLTNGDIGAKETFTEHLPTYNGVADLESKINFYLSNDVEREKLAKKLHAEVLRSHTYRHRAIELKNLLTMRFIDDISISIKIAVPHQDEINECGEYHFAASLASSLKKLGYRVRVDALPDWYCDAARSDDVVIVIRGHCAYNPLPNQLNLLWQISHPDEIDDAEYSLYDHVYVASEPYAKLLQQRNFITEVTPLLQCTDPQVFYYDAAIARHQQILFVGNSRRQFRPAVRYAVAAKLPVKVFGSNWEDYIDSSVIAGGCRGGSKLRQHYAGCDVLLIDHLDSMSRYGFISNQLFDAVACGAIVVSDQVAGIHQLFRGLVYQYEASSSSFSQAVDLALQERKPVSVEREILAREVAESHSFDARAGVIAARIAIVFGSCMG